MATDPEGVRDMKPEQKPGAPGLFDAQTPNGPRTTTKTTAESEPPEVVVVPPAAPLATIEPPDPGAPFANLARVAGGDTSAQTLADLDHGLEIFERWTDILRRAYFITLRRTRPWDWVISRLDGDEGQTVMGYFCATGYPFVSEVYGIRPLKAGTPEEEPMFGPVGADGRWRPESETLPGGVIQLSGWAVAHVGLTRRQVMVEGTRRSDEPFTGRQVDEHGQIVKRGGVGALPGDHRSSLLSLLKKKLVAEAAGIRVVPGEDLETAWGEEPGKTLGKCRLGHGFGTSAERKARAPGVSDAGLDVERVLLRDEILSLTGGDKGAAVALLQEVTAWRSKDGQKSGSFDHVDRMTRDFMFPNAWEKLRSHPHFGPTVTSVANVQAKRAAAVGGEGGQG